MNSIAIISDAINNLSDMCSSIITIASSKISNMHADKEHPFGHGRIEYIASLVVSFIIIMVGIELFKTSVDKIFKPEVVQFSIPLFVILILSVITEIGTEPYTRGRNGKFPTAQIGKHTASVGKIKTQAV